MKAQQGTHGEEFLLECSGRTFYANLHVIGIGPHLTISEGFDGDVDLANDPPDWWKTHPDYQEEVAKYFTAEEKAELADYMIALWKEYKRTHAHDTLDNAGK